MTTSAILLTVRRLPHGSDRQTHKIYPCWQRQKMRNINTIKTSNLNTTNRPCHWYAVQVGADDTDCGTGAYRKDVACAMARMFASGNPGTQVQVVLCTTDDDFCLSQWTVQEEGETIDVTAGDCTAPCRYYQVVNKAGYAMDYESALQHMDVAVLDAVIADLADGGDETQLDAQDILWEYEDAHAEEFGEEWFLSSSNPCW